MQSLAPMDETYKPSFLSLFKRLQSGWEVTKMAFKLFLTSDRTILNRIRDESFKTLQKKSRLILKLRCFNFY
jgi:hypothetical protein